MFDIGFWELLLIGVVALLVVGPERLPALATFVGQWVGRARRYVNHMRREIEQELESEHLKGLLDEQSRELQSLRREVADVKGETEAVARNIGSESPAGGSTEAESARPDGSDDASGSGAGAPDARASGADTADGGTRPARKKRAASGKKKSAAAGKKKSARKKSAAKKKGASRKKAAASGPSATGTPDAVDGSDDGGQQHSQPGEGSGR